MLEDQILEKSKTTFNGEDINDGLETISSEEAIKMRNAFKNLVLNTPQKSIPMGISPVLTNFSSAVNELSSHFGSIGVGQKYRPQSMSSKHTGSLKTRGELDEIPVEIVELEDFGRLHFETHTSSEVLFKKNRVLDIQDMLVHTKNPITTSMTMLVNEKDIERAVEAFKLLLRVIDPTAKKSDFIFRSIKAFILYGIDYPTLRDELFVQICRQVTLPPNEINKSWDLISLHGWEIFTIAAASFSPTKAFLRYLVSFVRKQKINTPEQSAIFKLISITEYFIKHTMLHGPRSLPPSFAEIESLMDMNPLYTEIIIVGGKPTKFMITMTTTSHELLKTLSRSIGLNDYTGWSLYEVTGVGERAIKPSEYICDVLAEQESHKVPLFDTVDEIPRKTKLVFKKRIFRVTQERKSFDAVEYNLLYHQAVENVRNYVYPILPEEAVSLCALRMQGEFPLQDVSEKTSITLL
ncbi:cytochrome c oxidase subunit 1 [Nowakowskiella sp. JEL0078]|nr:cytochrome c oxidase subunit 1 [Nowakowskiella sp. JEL0078]